MRLVCPNCGAQYEVGDDVIPHDGRDVQCSNCSHTWFEQPGASVAAENGETLAPPMPPQEPEPQPAPEVDPTEAPVSSARGREMAPEVADILREEAAYEEAVRRGEADPIETQPDLDLSQDPAIPAPAPESTAGQDIDAADDDYRSRAARERLSRMRGEETAAVGAASVAGAVAVQQAVPQDDAPRRDLLPDIEEINSTLRQDGANHVQSAETDEPERSSRFARGFMFVVLIALLALAAYVFAPQISAAVPETEQALTSYVDWVDGRRLWFDAQIQNLATAFAPELVN